MHNKRHWSARQVRAGVTGFGMILALAAPLASAGDFYLGASGGLALTNVSNGDITDRLADEGLGGTGRVSDTERAGWKVYAGYQWMDFLALEGGFTSLGDMSVDFSGVGMASAKQLAEIAPVSGDLWELALVSRFPINDDWHFLARAGAIRWDMEYSLGNESGNLKGTNAVLGLGVERHIAGHWFARLGWDRYVVPREDTDLLSLGVVYRFGQPAARAVPVARPPATPPRQPVARAPEPVAVPPVAAEPVVQVEHAPAPVVVAEPKPVLAPTPEAPTVASIQFALGSAEVGAHELDDAIAWLKANPQARVEVHGFTDTTGPVEFNRALSRQRADNVRAALLEGGVDPAQVSVSGHGSQTPRADNETLDGRRLNRRVEVNLLP